MRAARLVVGSAATVRAAARGGAATAVGDGDVAGRRRHGGPGLRQPIRASASSPHRGFAKRETILGGPSLLRREERRASAQANKLSRKQRGRRRRRRGSAANEKRQIVEPHVCGRAARASFRCYNCAFLRFSDFLLSLFVPCVFAEFRGQ